MNLSSSFFTSGLTGGIWEKIRKNHHGHIIVVLNKDLINRADIL